MKRTITVFTLIALTITALFPGSQVLPAKSSTTAGDTILTAGQFYESGQYKLAAQSYQQLVDQGYADSNLYFNLGNAYFKQGDFGRAILYYRQAQQLAPRDTDIKINLNLARAQVVDQLEDSQAVGSSGYITRLDKTTQQWFTTNQLAIFALGAWILFALLVIAFTSSRKGSRLREGLQYALIGTLLALAVGIVGLGSRLYTDKAHPKAVIVAHEVAVTSGPGAQYVTEFALHNGAEVDVLETRENWVRLSLPGSQMQGWVPTGTVEAVGG